MVAKENLQFSFISFFCFFPSLFWCRYGDTLSSRLHSQHCIPPSCSALATPPHLAAFPIFMLFGLWSQWSWALCLAKTKTKATLFHFHSYFFLQWNSLLSPFFPMTFYSKITTSLPFLESSFISAGFFCLLPLHFRSLVSPSVIPECFIFLNSLLLTLFISIRFQCYKQYSCCHHSYYWTNYTFCLLNRIYIEICFMPVVPTHKCHDF